MAGLTTSLLIGAGIAAGGGVASAAIGSRAAGKAAETQAESADEAIALQREMYQQQRQDTAPWRETGGQSVQTLGALMGLPSGPTASQQGGPGLFAQAVPGMIGAANEIYGRLQRGEIQGEPINPRTMEPMNPSRHAPYGSPDAVSRGAQQQNASGYVMMESPDGGERQAVPREQVDHLVRAGARIV